jgi:lysophospholipase L1-like esterase
MHRKGWTSIIGTALLLAPAVFAQDSDVAAARKGLQAWRDSRASKLMDDFGELARYREANAKLKPPAVGERRVVFYGDSITDIWPLDRSFPSQPFINRGIGGQTTSQMLIRFRSDVIDLQPAAVVILAGTNDIAGNTGPISLTEIEGNLASMAELAKAHGIRVVLSSVLPVHNYTPEAKPYFPLRPPDQIRELNRWLQDYCAREKCVYLDYYTALLNEKGFLRKELAEDGLHPNAAGYAIMAPLAKAAIVKALAAH